MKNNLAYIIYTSVFIGTIIMLFIVYKDINNDFAFAFIIGFLIILLLSFIYFIVLVLYNMRKLKWLEIRKRVIKFVIYFIVISACTYLLKYIFQHSKIDIYDFGTPLGISVSLAFFDLIFSKEERES
ncbi:hypothetical protein CUU66_18315 [Peribacillus deserti]|uniref:Uncharacterized protein n=1 Tax=Peribacillus deserti TaxID=673318 RepID=A0A2N5M272_9BACI|nr:hypothetical protein CUU66_18315 [Peribacillus deserti]